MSVPNYGPLDGISFSPQLTGGSGTPRDWIFYHYDHHPGISKLARWAQTKVYKLYDTSAINKNRRFYNISIDINEKKPIPDNSLTTDEAAIKQQLLAVINNYIAQGVPLFSNLSFNIITDSSVNVRDSIMINGGSTITASGFVWSTNTNPTISSSHSVGNTCIGLFSDTIKGLLSNTTYYVRAYATNYAGTTYSTQISFKTKYHAPVATNATLIDSNHFTANWNVITGASSYKLDVSTDPTFSINKALNLTEAFNNGKTPPVGWAFIGTLTANTTSYGQASPSIVFNSSKAQIITPPVTGTATQLKFWIRGINTDSVGSLLVEGFNGNTWVPIQTFNNLPKAKAGSVKTINIKSNPALPANISQFRFTYTKSAGTLALDDVSINYNSPAPYFVAGYNNLNVTGTSKLITGLNPGTVYYYRLRASSSTNKSDNSNVIITSTCKKPVITNVDINNISCNGSNDGFINVTDTGSVGTLVYNWTSDNNFTSSNQNINNLSAGVYSVTITANGGCAVDTSVTITEPLPVSSTTEAAPISCSGGTTTLTVTATGGNGNYHYTLFDGTNTTGPQDDNHFIVSAGNYIVTVEDDNHCSFTTSSVEVDAPTAIEASASADPISCSGGTTTLTVTATGGNGNYHYTLFNGTNTTGPQDDNYFTIISGNYTITVTDGNGCSYDTSITIDDGTETCSGFALMNNNGKAHNTKLVIKNSEFKVDVFPNPSSNYFLLRINTISTEKIEVYVTDIYGKKVYQYENNNKEKYLLGQELSSGMYFVKVIQGKNIKTLKLIKQK